MGTIALIDNDQDSRELLQELLEDQGHDVELFTGGQDFLVKFRPGLFRLILMDLAMPGMDGYELLGIVQREDPPVPVVAVTAMAHDAVREQSHAAGFSDFVTKPFTDLPTLFGLIRKHLHGQNPE